MTERSVVPGVVLFDDPISRGAAWACSAEHEPRRIGGAHELSSAGVWLTNLDDQHFRTSGLANNRFRAQDYLRVNISALANEVGAAVTVAGGRRAAAGPDCAKSLANLFGSVMDVAGRLGVDTYPPFQLRIGFRRARYLPSAETDLEPEVRSAIANACQRYTVSERKKMARAEHYEERTTIFTLHRHTHAMDVLSQPIPYGRWRTAPQMSPDEIDAHPRPLLLQVQVQRMSDEMGGVVNFGGAARRSFVSNGVRQLDASPRRWITQPEYRFLRQHGSISVETILEAEGYRENPLLALMPLYGILQGISPAFQLAIESFWTSIYRDERGRTDHSAAAAWVGAYDRLACLSEALVLAQRDPEVDIAGFGFGRIVVKGVNPGQRFGKWCWDIVKGRMLIPPMAVDGAFAVSDLNEQDPVQVLQSIQLAGDPSILLSLDKPALQDFDHQIAQAYASNMP